MPSIEHELLLDLSRNRPDFLTELLRDTADGITVLPGGTPHPCSADLTQSTPTEFRADQVLVYTEKHAGTGHERTVGALVIEVQRTQDDHKRYSWPAYVALTRAHHQCPTSLVVLCPSRDIATWAARPIWIGPKGFGLQATVIGPDDTPCVRNPDHAAASPELAVISAVVHSHDPDQRHHVLHALVEGFEPTAVHGKGDIAERHQRYLVGVGALLPEDARTIMEKLMQDTKYGYQDIFTRHFTQGETKGRTEGEAAGEARGEARGEAKAILHVLESRGLDIPDDIREHVLACPDQETLDTWLTRAVTVASPKELFD